MENIIVKEESNLVKHARKELELAGLFDKDSDYNGMISKAVMKLIEVFSKQGHSGCSARQVIKIFHRVANYGLLMPINKPKEGEYNIVAGGGIGKDIYQSCRLSSLFSSDSGKTWYDIDLPGKRRQYVKFPYLPK